MSIEWWMTKIEDILRKYSHADLPSILLSSQRPRPRFLDCMELEERTLLSATPLVGLVATNPSAENPQEIQTAAPAAETSEGRSMTAAGPHSDHNRAGSSHQTAVGAQVKADWSASGVNSLIRNASQDALENLSRSLMPPTATSVIDDLNELVFVDPNLPDCQELLADLITSANNDRKFDIVLLDPNGDGIEQISRALTNFKDLGAVHFLTHGNDGTVKLGNVWLSAANLDAYAGDIAGWHTALANQADLLFYGCELAENADGRTLVDAIHALTGADVAASADATGDPRLGGDWNLEYVKGYVDSSAVLSPGLQNPWTGLLAASPQFRVNTTTAGMQQTVSGGPKSMAMAPDGSYVVVWSDDSLDGSGTGIFAQRYDALGVSQGSQFQINAYTSGNQTSPTVAMDQNGNFVVAWQSQNQDGSGWGIYARRFDSSGAPLGGEFRVNSVTTNDQAGPAISMAKDGKFVIVWQHFDPAPGLGWNIEGQRYDANGVARGSQFQVNASSTGDQTNATVSMGDSGSFVVAWQSQDQDGSGWSICGQQYKSNGSAQGSEFLVNTTTSNDQTNASIAMDDSGQFVIAWQTATDSGWDICAQRYKSNGNLQGTEFLVNGDITNDQMSPTVAMNDDGNLVVVWQSQNQDGSGWGIFGQSYDKNGVALGAAFQVNTTTAGDQWGPSVEMDDVGNFVVVWNGNGPGDGAGVFGQARSFNYAPVLSGARDLTSIKEDEVNNSGTLVSHLIAGKVTDADHNALSGIAVTAVDNSNGAWQYSTNGGSVWQAFGTPADSGAILLSADANTFVRFVPLANSNGTIASGLTFRAWDQTSGTSGGTADTSVNGGQTAFSSATASSSIDVTSVNDAPAGADKTVVTQEDTAYTFTAADFGFSDPNDAPANNLLAVKISSLLGSGTLVYNGVAVAVGQFVSATDLDAGRLVFIPADNSNGTDYASFTFQVQDDGGTAHGGINLDPTPKTMTIDVTPVNHAPPEADQTFVMQEDTPETMTIDVTPVNDAPPGADQTVVALENMPETMTTGETSANDAPGGADHAVVAQEDTTHTFTAANSVSSAPSDTSVNDLLEVKIVKPTPAITQPKPNPTLPLLPPAASQTTFAILSSADNVVSPSLQLVRAATPKAAWMIQNQASLEAIVVHANYSPKSTNIPTALAGKSNNFTEDSLLGDVLASQEKRIQLQDFVLGSAVMATTGLTLGCFAWLQGGLAVSSIIAQIPSWGLFDPLVILSYMDKERFEKRGNVDTETLETIIDRRENPQMAAAF